MTDAVVSKIGENFEGAAMRIERKKAPEKSGAFI